MKYIPEVFLPKIKPKIIDDIIIESDIIGKIVGINLKPIDFDDESQLQEFLNAIIKLKSENSTRLFIEGHENLSKEKINNIEQFTNMKIPDGENTKIINLPFVMKDICKTIKENLEEKEILVICDNKEKTKRIIKEISKDVKFVTAIGCEEDNDEIYEYILEETGLSLFYPSNIKRILENYSIIINLIDDVELDFSKVRRNCIVFDFGKGNSLDNKKRPPFIEDFGFNLADLGIKENKFIKSKILSSLSEALTGDKNKKIKYLYSDKNYYSIKDYVNLFIKLKGKL